MTRRAATPDTEARGKSLADYVDQATDYIVRTVELILLASAFGYAAIKGGSLPAGIVAFLLLALTCMHVGLRTVTSVGEWIDRRYPKFWHWSLAAGVAGGALAGILVAAAVVALYDVIIDASQ